MSLSREEAARKLGMKTEEVREVNHRGGGVYDVTTHDGMVTEIAGDKLTTRVGTDVTVAVATDDGPKVIDAAGGPDGQAAVVTEAMALPVDERADVRVVDEALFLAADPEDLAELGLARLGGSPVAHPILDGDRNQRDTEAGFRGDLDHDFDEGDEAADEAELAEAIAGNADGVRTWVGNDPDRAQRAIDAEKARTSTPRVTLLHDLDKIAKGAGR